MLDILKQLFGLLINGIASMTAQEAQAKLGQKGIVMIDVRESVEYHGGHAKGARLMPLGTLAQRWQELRNYDQVIVVCRSGNRSMMACRQLSALGLANVVSLNGGMISWTRAKLPTQY